MNNYKWGGRGYGKTQAIKDFLKDEKYSTMMQDEWEKISDQAKRQWEYGEGKKPPKRPYPSNPNVEMEVINMVSISGLKGWSAPHGWNKYLIAGNFKGCRPIITPGAKINNQAFEAINFEMV